MDVFGDIQGSDIHHMYYGMYSYGHQGGVWTNNKMHDNIVYGERDEIGNAFERRLPVFGSHHKLAYWAAFPERHRF